MSCLLLGSPPQGQAAAEGLGSLTAWSHCKSGSKHQVEHMLRPGRAMAKKHPKVHLDRRSSPVTDASKGQPRRWTAWWSKARTQRSACLVPVLCLGPVLHLLNLQCRDNGSCPTKLMITWDTGCPPKAVWLWLSRNSALADTLSGRRRQWSSVCCRKGVPSSWFPARFSLFCPSFFFPNTFSLQCNK